MTDPLHPIGPRDRDIEPVQRLLRPARDGGRGRQEPQHEEPHEQPPRRNPELPPLPPASPDDDDGNPHIDVRV